MNNNDFRTQLHHCTHHVTHLEKGPGPLWASVWQTWMYVAQIALKKKTSFEDCDWLMPSCCTVRTHNSILAQTTLFLGCSQRATEHSMGIGQGLPVQYRTSLMGAGCAGVLLPGHHTQSCTGAWGFSCTFLFCPLSSFSGVRCASHSAETPDYPCCLLAFYFTGISPYKSLAH